MRDHFSDSGARYSLGPIGLSAPAPHDALLMADTHSTSLMQFTSKNNILFSALRHSPKTCFNP